MSNIEQQYLDLVKDILENGYTKGDRTGTGTKSVFGRTIRHRMSDGYPLLTTKKVAFKTMVTELLWFLRGDTNIKYLVDNGCYIWVGDAYKNYCNQIPEYSKQFTIPKEEYLNKIKTDDEFAKKWGELGHVYPRQWRSWGEDFKQIPNESGDKVYHITTTGIDQIANAIHLLKTDPDSRRILVNSWNVGELDQMVLPPCHYSFQFYTRELTWEERVQWAMKNINVEWENLYIVEEIAKLTTPKRAVSLLWNQRSVDVGLGLPFNIASYALLLEIIAKQVNMIPEEVIGNLGDCHIYLNHVDGLKEQLTRTPYELPKLNINTEFWPTESGECGVGLIDAKAVLDSFSNDSFCKCLLEEDIQLYKYQYHPAIKLPLSN